MVGHEALREQVLAELAAEEANNAGAEEEKKM